MSLLRLRRPASVLRPLAKRRREPKPKVAQLSLSAHIQARTGPLLLRPAAAAPKELCTNTQTAALAHAAESCARLALRTSSVPLSSLEIITA